MSVLVTGGAGYIGAHVTRLLAARGDSTVVVDDLSSGLAARLAGTPLVQIDLSEDSSVGALTELMQQHRIDAVVHLAAKKRVGESVARPSYYFRQNVGGLTNLLDAMELAGVRRLVFSSSAAVYGNPEQAARGPLEETVVPRPISPYGQSKLIGEWLCDDAARAWGLRWCALRYFNVVGAGAEDLGDLTAQNLVPLVFEAIDRGQDPVVFGDDYPTPDGTCVRDYVHVADLADAHLAALDWLGDHTATSVTPVFNIGSGTGTSVRDVLAIVGAVSGRPVTGRVADRRPGDPASLVADVSLVGREIGWRSTRTLEDAIASAWSARTRPAASAT